MFFLRRSAFRPLIKRTFIRPRTRISSFVRASDTNQFVRTLNSADLRCASFSPSQFVQMYFDSEVDLHIIAVRPSVHIAVRPSAEHFVQTRPFVRCDMNQFVRASDKDQFVRALDSADRRPFVRST